MSKKQASSTLTAPCFALCASLFHVPAKVLRIMSKYQLQDDKLKRHLLRLWIAPEDDRPLPDKYKEILGGSVEQGHRGGIIVKGTDLKITAEAE